jgi:hypothetical protein
LGLTKKNPGSKENPSAITIKNTGFFIVIMAAKPMNKMNNTTTTIRYPDAGEYSFSLDMAILVKFE